MRQQRGNKETRFKLIDIAALLILFASLAVAVCAGTVYAKKVMDYNTSDEEFDALRSEYVTELSDNTEELEDSCSPEPEDNPSKKQGANLPPIEAPLIDWDGLKAENGDIIGWLEVPAVEIDYPVVQGTENQEYLHKSISGEWRTAGSIFLDSWVSPDMSDSHSIIYGHNMRNGSMFAPLRDFNDKGVYDRCPYFWLCTERKNLLYQIVSVHRAITEDESYTLFPSYVRNREFEIWMECEIDKSMITCHMPERYMKRMLTLSTCTPSSDNTRQLVQGVLIGEYRASA